MALICIIGDRKEANKRLVELALAKSPAMMVDAANCANIHDFSHDMEGFTGLSVVPAESLYRFLPTLKELPRFAQLKGTRRIFVTTFSRLFNYDSEEENADVFEYAWEILKSHSGSFDVYAAVEAGTVHAALAKKHGAAFIEAKMGHTVMSQRMMTDLVLKELESYGRSLREDDRSVYTSLLKEPLKHLSSISYASSHSVWAMALVSMILEQQKRIIALENERLADGCIPKERHSCAVDQD